MKALRWHGRGDVRLDDVPDPQDPDPGQVVLRIRLCGVCGTDLEEYRHGPITIPVRDRHPLSGRQAPITLGHEVVGEVVAVGPNTDGHNVGDRVVPDGLSFCGECGSCRRGAQMHCVRSAMIGLHTDGGLAEYLTVPAAMCVAVPERVPDRAAVLAEPLAVSVRAVRRAGASAGERVLVIGAGTIGQCVAQLASGVTAQVGLLDTDVGRVAATRRAVPALDASSVGPPEHPWTGATDCVLDCAGTRASLAAALRLVRPGGRVMLVGAAVAPPRSFSPHDLLVREVSLLSTFSHDRDEDTRVAVDLLTEGTLRLDHVVTAVVPLGDAVQRVFANPATNAPGFKTVVDPRHGTRRTTP